jgi:hypothetical protein
MRLDPYEGHRLARDIAQPVNLRERGRMRDLLNDLRW